MTPRLIRGGHRRDGKSPCPEPCTAPCDGMDDSIEEVAEKAHNGLLEEDSESIKSVSVTYKISVKDKKIVQEVEHDLDRDTWKNIDFSSFDVKEEMGNCGICN